MVIITRTSPISGIINEMALNISPEEFDHAYERWESGTYIQDAFHMLNASEREFIKTGITPVEWDTIFGTDSEE